MLSFHKMSNVHENVHPANESWALGLVGAESTPRMDASRRSRCQHGGAKFRQKYGDNMDVI